MITSLIGALLVSATPASAPAPAPATPAEAPPGASPTMQVSGGQWFDGTRFVADDWYVVDGRFTRNAPAEVSVRIDLGGRHVLPPFAEAHNHDMQSAFFGAMSSRDALDRGIFYSLQMCAHPEGIAGFRNFLNRPTSVDVVFAEACISSSDGHPLGIALASSEGAAVEDFRDKSFLAVDSIADLDARWPRVLESRTAMVKLILINAEDHEANRARADLFGYNGLDPALLPEIVRRAHAADMRVAVHADSAFDFATAVSSGADIIAHLPGYRFVEGKGPDDYRIDDAAIAEAARRGTTVIPTAVAASHFVTRNPDRAEALRAVQADNLRRLIAAGVPLATGSDMVGTGSVLDEIEWLSGLDVLPRADLLRIATMDTPHLLFPDRAIGRFAEGAEASFIVLDADPLAGNLPDRPWLRMKQGVLLAP